MKRNHLLVTLIGFIVFLVITIAYYLANDYQIEYIEKNNIKAVNTQNNDYEEILLPVAYLEYDINKTYYGYINTSGEVAISLNYQEAHDFDENFLAVVKYKDKYGLINTKNEKVLELKYDKIKYLGEGIYYYVLNKKGYLARFISYQNLENIKEVNYDDVGIFNEGLAYVVRDKKVGYIDKNGNEVIPPQYNYRKDFDFSFYNDYAFIYQDKKFGIIDKTGNIIVSPKYDDVLNKYILKFDFTEIVLSGYELIPVKVNGEWGYIKPNGDEVITPKYQEAYPFTDNNLARVKFSEGYYNFIDPLGNHLNDDEYVDANDFYNGYAMASFKENKKEGLIDKNGEEVIPFEYDYVGTYQQNRILTIKNGISKYHLIDDFNNEDTVIRIKYYLGDDMTSNKVFFATDDKIDYVILNQEGKRKYFEVTVKAYKQITYKGKTYIKLVAYENAHNLEYLTYIDEDGKIIWKVYK